MGFLKGKSSIMIYSRWAKSNQLNEDKMSE